MTNLGFGAQSPERLPRGGIFLAFQRKDRRSQQKACKEHAERLPSAENREGENHQLTHQNNKLFAFTIHF